MSSSSCSGRWAGAAWSLLLAVGLLVPPATAGAEGDAAVALRLPGASEEPASVLLGSSPAQVQRPREPVAAAVALASKVSSGDSGPQLPQALAVAIAPYWLRSRPGLSYADYASPGWRSLYRNFSLSLATRAVDGAAGAAGTAAAGGSAPKATRLALGARTVLLPGRPDGDPEQLRRCQRWASDASARVAAALAHELATDKLPQEPEAIEKRNQALLRAQLRRLPDGCDTQAELRRGFVLELDVAGSADFQAGRADSGSLQDAAAWVTGGYHGRHWSLDGLLRGALLQLDDGLGPAQVETGLRVGRAWQRLGGWVEALARRGVGDDADERHGYRAAVGLDVSLSEAVWLTMTFGRDFRADDPGSLLALANLRWEVRERRVDWLPSATP